MSDAAVGSISHILKTAFKDVYDEESNRNELSKKGAVAEAETAVEAKEDGGDDEAEITEPADPPAGEENEDAGDGEEKDAYELKEEDAPEPLAEPFPENLAILPHLQEELVARQKAIDEVTTNKSEKATDLAAYLEDERKKAANAEELEEEMLKKQGIMVGQHIPPLPSKLDIKAGQLQSYGDYSNNLIIAKEFVEANKVNNLRRTGNLPISELAEQKIEERARKAAARPVDIPGYAQMNKASDIKTKLLADRYASLTQVRKLEETEKFAATGGIRPKYEAKYEKVKNELTGHEKAENREILKGMQHKMNYLRNPHNAQGTVGRMLTRNDAAFDQHEDFRATKNGRGGTRINQAGGATATAMNGVPPQGGLASSVELSGVGASLSLHEQSSSLTVPEAGVRERGSKPSKGKVGKESKSTINGGNSTPSPLFIADPPELVISQYEVGKPVTLPIAFRNVSSISRMVRIIPPRGELFAMASLKYPPNSAGGFCAPGMGVTTTITFNPTSLGDAEDSLEVETEGGNFTVPIKAHRDGPRLSLPPIINVGSCMVGDAMRVQVHCVNTGGPGRFRLVSDETFNKGLQLYTDCNAEEYNVMGCLRLAPFTVYPVEFALDTGDSVNIILEYVPLALSAAYQKIYALCDNTQVFEYTLQADSKQLDVKVVEVNEVSFDTNDDAIRRECFFNAANLGIEQHQEVVVSNDSGLPVEYEWVWLDKNTHEGEFNRLGNLALEKRDEEDAYRGDGAGFTPAWGMMGIAPGGNAEQGSIVPNDDPQLKGLGAVSKPPTAAPSSANPGTANASQPPNSAGFGDFGPMAATENTHAARAGAVAANADDGMLGTMTLRPLTGSPDELNANRVRGGPFVISPARGTLATDGLENFKICFTARQTEFEAMKAVLMLRNVPHVALQDAAQPSRLSKLAHEGHGQFCRLLSWIEAVGQEMNVPDPDAARELAEEKEAMLEAAHAEDTGDSQFDVHAGDAEGEEDFDEGSFVSDAAPPFVREVVVSLATIRNLVFSHANGAVLPSDIFAIEAALRYILVHTHHYITSQDEDEEEEMQMQEELSPEEEEKRLEVIAAARNEDLSDKLAIFYRNPAPQSPSSRTASPGRPASNPGPRPVELVDPSFSLRHNHINLTEALAEPVRAGADEEGDQSRPSTGAAAASVEDPDLLGTGEEDGYLRYSMSHQSVDQVDDRTGRLCAPGLLPEHYERLLDHVYLTPSAVVRLLGQFVAEELDGQVKHEAVDYLRAKALGSFSSLSVSVGGEGKSQKISLSPPLLSIGGSLPMEKTWTGKVTLCNPSNAIAEVEFRQELMTVSSMNANASVFKPTDRDDSFAIEDVEGMDGGEGGLVGVDVVGEGSNPTVDPSFLSAPNSDTGIVRLNKMQVELDPPRLLLMPNGEAEVSVSVTSFCLGKYDITIPCRSTNSQATLVDPLNITLDTRGPKLRFLQPEVDLGLAGVGSQVEETLTFTNEGATAASFHFTALTEEDMQRVMAEAACINEDGSPKEEDDKDIDDTIMRANSYDTEMSTGLNGGDGATAATSEAPGANAMLNNESSQAMSRGPGGDSLFNPSKMSGFTGIPRHAVTQVVPASGSIEPGETVTVTVYCQGGTNPERVRGSLRVKVGSVMKEVDPMPDQYLSFRCEVQAPKTVMYPMAIDVGKVYVGVPVYFEVTTENICNLPAAYKLERPGGSSSAYTLKFDRPEGPLGAKEKVTVKAEFTALQPGVIDDIIANKIRGVAAPLGFILSGTAKTALVDTVYLGMMDDKNGHDGLHHTPDLVNDNDGHDGVMPVPEPLAHPSCARFPDNADPPTPLPPRALDFGSEVELYERKMTKFAVRNLSPIPVMFTLAVAKYPVKGDIGPGALSGQDDDVLGKGHFSDHHKGTDGALGPSHGHNKRSHDQRQQSPHGDTAGTSRGSARIDRKVGDGKSSTRKLLVPHEEGANKFHSHDGRKHAEANVQRKENRLYLTSGLGASYLVDTRGSMTGTIEPWGVTTVTVRTFNDMPGGYDDRLDLSFVDTIGIGWSKTIAIPLKMTVTGCPLVVDKSTYGMTEEKEDKVRFEGETPAAVVPSRSKKQQMLSFGFTPVGSDVVERELVVTNNGSMPGTVLWKVRAMTGELNGPVKVSINVEEEEAEDEVTGEMKEELKVRTVLGFWADAAKETPFSVSPKSAVVLPYSKSKFKVTMHRTDIVAHESAKLIGTVKFVDAAPSTTNTKQNNVHTTGGGAALENSVSNVSLTAGSQDAAAGAANAAIAAGGSLVGEESTLIPAPSTANQSYRLSLLLDANIVNPSISIDKRVFVADGSETVVSLAEGGMKFKANAAEIFGKGHVRQPCSKVINIVNPTETTLTCSVATEGHFTLASANDDASGNKPKLKSAMKKNTSLMSKTMGLPSKVGTSVGSDSLGKTVTLTPHASSSFAISFAPSRNMRQTIARPRDVTVGGQANEEDGNLVVTFNTGQRMYIPLLGSIATPFIAGSSPKVNFGVCRVGTNCEGLILLTNPTLVNARWTVVHVPPVKNEASRRKKANDAMAIRVPGYTYPEPETDDPSVFIITPSAGEVAGPTLTVTAAIAAMPKDVNRTRGVSGVADPLDATVSNVQEVVPQRLAETSWSSSTLTLKDNLNKRHDGKQAFEADANFPVPVTIQFRPSQNKKYGSRFRFTCEFGNSFDVMLFGDGTYEEHEHAPLYPKPGAEGSHLPY